MNQGDGGPTGVGKTDAAAPGSRRRRVPGGSRSEQVVVDASLAVKWVLPEEHSDRAVDLLREWKNRRIQPIAPALLPIEAANAIYKRVRRGELTPAEGRLALRTLLQAGILIQEDQRLCLDAWELAHQFERPAVYDAVYLALAFTVGCDLWTGDERLVNAVAGRLPWVKWVGQYHPSTAESKR